MGPRATRPAWPLVWLLAGLACSSPRTADRSASPTLARPVSATPGQDGASSPGVSPSKDLFSEGPATPVGGDPGQGRLLGQWPIESARVQLSGHKEPLRAVLAELARISRLNFALADEVAGDVTTSIESAPWMDVLAALLAAKDLVAVREGNVVRVLRREDHEREMELSP